MALVRFPSWPLQFIDVFDRSEQPARFTTGAPLSTSDMCDAGCPLSSVKIQELSGSLAVAVAETATWIVSIRTIPSIAVGTLALTVPVYCCDCELNCGVPTEPKCTFTLAANILLAASDQPEGPVAAAASTAVSSAPARKL